MLCWSHIPHCWKSRVAAHISKYALTFKPKYIHREKLKRLSLQLRIFFEKIYFLFKSFVKVELSYVFTINLLTKAENCMEK